MPRQIKKDFFQPHPTQEQALASDARFVVASCGRRWGKGNLALRAAGEVSAKIPGGRTWVVSPTYDQTRPMWRKAVAAFGQISTDDGYPWMLKPRIKDREIPLANGSVFEFKSADDPDSLRGAGDDLVHVIIDEAAYVDGDAWGILSFSMADNLASATLISTPNRHNPKNWFYDMWLRGQPKLRAVCDQCDGDGCEACEDTGHRWIPNTSYDPDFASFQFSSFDNPHVPGGEIKRLIERENLSEVDILREIYGEFVGGESVVVDLAMIRDCEIGNEEGPGSDATYVSGVDLGRVSSYTVITTIRAPRTQEESPHVVAFERFQGAWNVQRERIAAHARKYMQPFTNVDATGLGDTFKEELRRAGVYRVNPIKFSGVSKPEIIAALLAAISAGELTWPPNRQLEDELVNLEQKVLPSGQVQYRAGKGHTDDMVMSLGLAWWAYLKEVSPQRPKLWAVGVGGPR